MPFEKQAVASPDKRQEETALVNRFLDRLYQVAGYDEHQAVDEVFNFLDDQLLAGRFSVCDLALSKVEPKNIPLSAVVSCLMVTLRAKEKLAFRPGFLDRTVGVLAQKEGQKEAEALLGKYR